MQKMERLDKIRKQIFLASYMETNRDANGGEKVVPQKQY